MLVFYFVFSYGFRLGGPGFVPFLLCGLVPWKWFQGSVQAAASTFRANVGMISQVDIPKQILVATTLLVAFLKFLVVLGLFIAYLLITDISISSTWFYLLPMLISLFLLIAGLSSVVALVTPFVQEFKLLVDNGLMMLFFMSGIFFDITERDPAMQDLLLLNPVARWIVNFRGLVLEGQIPSWSDMAIIAAVGLVTLVIGLTLTTKFDRTIAKVAL